MKTLQIFLLIAAATFLFSFGKGGFEAAMRTNIEAMYNANDNAELLNIANKFARIGAAEKKEWLPYYYSAYCHVMMTTRESDVTKWDGYLDTADASITKAEAQDADMIEIYALRGFSNMMRINVDPAVRGQEYAAKAVGYLQQASQLNDQNPRVVLMMAQMQYGTAQFSGSDTAPICDQFKKALELFDKETMQEGIITPTWGKPLAASMVKNCEG